jgi:predicted 3-demethylubiquinone-9 3-methyltransferase (glyoxalase superfamily)
METKINSYPGTQINTIGMQRINPFLWFNDNAEEAVNFYTSFFSNSKIIKLVRYGEEGPEAAGRPKGSVMTVDFELEGQAFAAINGGPVFKITPAISFFVNCATSREIDLLWEKLSEGGTVLMALDTYPFSEKYGWIQDKFGVSWQLILPGRKQKITPCLMFAGEQHKQAEKAINFYISVFRNSGIIQLERYTAGVGPEGAVVHSKFMLNGQEFIAMDSHMPMTIDFNPAISLVVNCKTQEEVDYYWETLSEGGDKSAQQCGWLKDKFGLSWQIVPAALIELLHDPDPVKAHRVMEAMLRMKKIDIAALKNAYEGK